MAHNSQWPDVQRNIWNGLLTTHKKLPELFSKQLLEQCMRITKAEVEKSVRTNALDVDPIIRKLTTARLTYTLCFPFNEAIGHSLPPFPKALPVLSTLVNMRHLMALYHAQLLPGLYKLELRAQMLLHHDITADLILYLDLVLRTLKLKSASQIDRAYDLAVWRKLNRTKPYIPVPETELQNIMGFTRHCHQMLTTVCAGSFSPQLAQTALSIYDGALVPLESVEDICRNIPVWETTSDPVERLMRLHGFANEGAHVAAASTPKSGAGATAPAWVYDEEELVGEQVTEEDMALFYEKLQAESKAPTTEPSRRKRIQHVLTDIDRTVRNERALLIEELRRQYGANVMESSLDGHRFLLRNKGAVAMWLPVLPDGSENLTKPHVSISSRNGPGFHITEGKSHFYYDATGKLRYGTVREGGTYSRTRKVPRDVATLAARSAAFFASKRVISSRP